MPKVGLMVAYDYDGGAAVNSGYGTLDVATGKVSGTWGGYDISGSRNLFASKSKAEQSAANDLLKPWLGAMNVAWEGKDGGNGLTVNVAKKGKAKVTGTLADGAKVSANAQLIVGAEWCCVPVTEE